LSSFELRKMLKIWVAWQLASWKVTAWLKLEINYIKK
jgi:hypothetical protein